MRCTVLLLLVVALGCPKQEATEEPVEVEETETEVVEVEEAPPEEPAVAAIPEAEPLPAPTVKLLKPGKAPRAPLQRSFKAGDEAAFEMTTSGQVTMKGGGWDSDYQPRPLKQTFEVKTDAVAEDGTADIAMVVSGVEEVEGEVENPTAKMLDITGFAGAMTVDAQGVVTGMAMSAPGPAPAGAQSKPKPNGIDMVAGYLRWAAPQLPTEPVGVGAKWRVTRVIPEYGTDMTEVTTFELLERTESQVVLGFRMKTSGKKRIEFEKATQNVRLQGNAKGRITLDLDQFTPASANLTHTLEQLVTIEGNKKDKLSNTTNRTVKLARK